MATEIQRTVRSVNGLSRVSSAALSVGTAQVNVPSLFRSRVRASTIIFEQGKDCISVWLNSLNSYEITQLLDGLVLRCNLNQLYFLWTTLESVSHHDFLCHLKRVFPTSDFSPFSTPVSRELKEKFNKSKRIENKMLYRVSSTVMNTEMTRSLSTHIFHQTRQPTTVINTTMLPEVNRPSTAPELVTIERRSPRTSSVYRRHMSSYTVGTSQYCKAIRQSSPRIPTTTTYIKRDQSLCTSVVPSSLDFLIWFSELRKDWQQQDLLQTIVWSLDERELYYLSALLLTRQYRDFIADLPEVLSFNILSYVSGKDIMRSATVSKIWYHRCYNEKLWKLKCSQIPIGIPTSSGIISWRQVFIDNIKLRRNWRLGRAVVSTLTSHTHRVLCVKVKERERVCASGGSDRTIRIWSLRDGKLLNTIYGHDTKNIWCLCFYGINFIISGSGDSSIRIWNYRTGTCERYLQGHTSTVWSIKQKGDVLISGANDKTGILWNIRQCKYMCHLLGHTGSVFSVDLNDTATVAFTASGDKTVRIWNVSDGQCMQSLSITTQHPVMSLHYSKDYIVCAAGTLISLWSVSTGERIKIFKGHQERVECVHLLTDSINGDTLVSGSRDKVIKYWNLNSGRCIRTLYGHSSAVNSVDRGSVYIVSASDDNTVNIWDFSPKLTETSIVK